MSPVRSLRTYIVSFIPERDGHNEIGIYLMIVRMMYRTNGNSDE